MSSGNDHDVIVLGGGAAGEHCTAALAARGLRVALVERELVGSECSYWACIPSKSLLRPGEAARGAREAGATAKVDVQAALAWRDFMVSSHSDLPWLETRREERLGQARQVLGLGGARAAEDRGAAMNITTAAEYTLMLTDPGPPPAAPGPGELRARERELVTLIARAAPTPRSPPSCASASAPSARTWTGSGTRPAAAAAPT